jgi:LPS export ABC transporter protein LptC
MINPYIAIRQFIRTNKSFDKPANRAGKFPHWAALNIFLFFCTAFFLSACENSSRDIDDYLKKYDLKEEAINVQTYLSQQGVMKAKLTAPLLYRITSDTQYVEFPKTLHVDFYNDSIKIESQLDALYGKYFENLNKVFLKDSVTVFNVKGDTLWAPELWWDQNTQRFFTDSTVRIRKKGDRIRGGKGLDAKQDLSDILIKDPTGFFVAPANTF